jgi:crotonobetainyl-CoA:carnitine CoA-transferase CaiB-like acyl-CoA transferase
MADPTSKPAPNGGLEFFKDLRVIELGLWMAAPSAAALLADLGADVIKVEPPKGDPSRGFFKAIGSTSELQPTFALDNRRKRSVVLDLSGPDGRAQLEDLLAESDVLVTNMRLPTLRKMGLGAEEVVARFPRLIYGSITAHGLRGPDADVPGYDVGAFWARSGLSHQLAGQSPLHAPGAYGDHITGLSMFAAILAGLLERQVTGRGGIVETSLLQTGTWVVGPDLAVQAALGRVNAVARRDEAHTPLVNSYRTSDDRWFFLTCVEVERHFANLARTIGHPELVDDERFADARGVRQNRRELIAILDAAFATATLDEWAARFDAADVWWQVVREPAEVLDDPQLAANGWLEDVESGPGITHPMVTSPIRVFGTTGPTPVRAPELGEHNVVPQPT